MTENINKYGFRKCANCELRYKTCSGCTYPDLPKFKWDKERYREIFGKELIIPKVKLNDIKNKSKLKRKKHIDDKRKAFMNIFRC